MKLSCVVLACAFSLLAQRSSDAARAQASYQRGLEAVQQGNLAAARMAFERAVKLSPQSPE
ncbi:MAG: hypothetical protein ACRD6I_12335, partial [Candidatus Acidiferrales bacterium]